MINDAWLRKKKTLNKERKAKGLEPLPDNRWTQALGIFITFNTVMLSFLIFLRFLGSAMVSKNEIRKGKMKNGCKITSN